MIVHDLQLLFTINTCRRSILHSKAKCLNFRKKIVVSMINFRTLRKNTILSRISFLTLRLPKASYRHLKCTLKNWRQREMSTKGNFQIQMNSLCSVFVRRYVPFCSTAYINNYNLLLCSGTQAMLLGNCALATVVPQMHYP